VAVCERPHLVQTDVADGTATITVFGEVDIATVPDLRAGLAKAIATNPGRLVVDLGATRFIDCSGVRAIAQACRDAAPDCEIILRSPNPLARKVIELTQMDQVCLIDE
jgi:anti-anti-sigma factor